MWQRVTQEAVVDEREQKLKNASMMAISEFEAIMGANFGMPTESERMAAAELRAKAEADEKLKRE
eukprot:1674164-Pyramimonas_sp.AAC.1